MVRRCNKATARRSATSGPSWLPAPAKCCCSICPDRAMAQPAVVVAFTSRCGTTETLAHAAAVGTVNARALPRLRRLTDDGQPAAPECADTLRRMRKEYVPPTEADIAGAQALIVTPSAGMMPSS